MAVENRNETESLTSYLSVQTKRGHVIERRKRRQPLVLLAFWLRPSGRKLPLPSIGGRELGFQSKPEIRIQSMSWSAVVAR